MNYQFRQNCLKMKLKIFLCLILAHFCASEIIEITEENMESIVFDKTKQVFVLFWSSEKHCPLCLKSFMQFSFVHDKYQKHFPDVIFAKFDVNYLDTGSVFDGINEVEVQPFFKISQKGLRNSQKTSKKVLKSFQWKI